MRILGILLCCLILGLSTVAFAEQPTTVFSKVVATKNMQGEIPEIDGLRYTNLQKSVNGILNSKDGYTQGKDSHDNHIKHGTASSQLIIVNKVLYHGLVRNFAGKSQKMASICDNPSPCRQYFRGVPP